MSDDTEFFEAAEAVSERLRDFAPVEHTLTPSQVMMLARAKLAGHEVEDGACPVVIAWNMGTEVPHA